ncbi:MAG TPA: methyl-accepting chemotaxis protein [Rectinemataceae bacterium]|nr:methyl-accepting chemotaxis protein [Rectinemataceae bacterium]
MLDKIAEEPVARIGVLRLRAKILLSFIVIVALMGATNVAAYAFMRGLYDKLDGMMTTVSLLGQISATAGTIYNHAGNYYAMRSDDDRDTALRVVSDNLVLLKQLDARMEDKAGKKEVTTLSARFSQCDDLMTQLGAAIVGKQDKDEINRRLDAISSLQEDILSRLSALSSERLDMYRLQMISMKRDRDRVVSILFATLSLIAAIAVALSLLLSTRLARPLASVTRTLGAISVGEGDLTTRIPVTSRDEIGDLAREFNQFSDSLEMIVLGVRTSADSLSGLGSRLTEGMTETSAAVEEIAANVESINRLILNQSASVEDTRATISSIGKVSVELRERIDFMAQALSDSTSLVKLLIGRIETVGAATDRLSSASAALLEASDVGRSKLAAVDEHVRAIAEQSQGLVETNEVIAGIASQTNLLAMNAAIEAAHAGDSGKGFAVVSDEIRKLAEKSASQAKETGRELKLIKSAIDGVVSATKEAAASFGIVFEQMRLLGDIEREVGETVDHEKTESARVNDALSGLGAVTTAVRSGADDVERMSGSIQSAIESLARITLEIKGGAAEISQGAADINGAMAGITSLSAENAVSVAELRSQVGKFQIRQIETDQGMGARDEGE